MAEKGSEYILAHTGPRELEETPAHQPVRPAAASWRQCVHDMHGPNSLDNTRSASLREPAQVAAVGHESIFREASSALSRNDERRKNISNMPKIGQT